MAFDTQTVTIKGAELLAAATAANQLIIDGCDATTGYMTQAQAVNISARPASPVSNTTDVTQLGSTAEHINSRVYFRTGVNAGGDVNTLFLYGHVASAPNDKFVIFVASSQTTFHLPVAGDVIDEWECALDIVYTINSGAVGYATQATYCSLSEFNLLKERTVTTHKEGFPTTGENQIVFGEKTFKDPAAFDDGATVSSYLDCISDVIFEAEDYPHGISFTVSETSEMRIDAGPEKNGTIYARASNFDFGNDATIHGYLRVLGDTSFYDENAAVFSQIIRTDGSNSTLELNLDWPNNTADAVAFSVSGDIFCDSLDLESDLDASGNGRFNGTLTVVGTSEFSDDVTLGNSANLVVDGGLQVDGESELNGDVTFTSGVYFGTSRKTSITQSNIGVSTILNITMPSVSTGHNYIQIMDAEVTISGVVNVDDNVLNVLDGNGDAAVVLSSQGVNLENAGTTTAVFRADTGNLTISGKMTVGNGLVGTASYKDGSNNLVVPIGGIVLAYIGKQSPSIMKYAGEIIQTTDFNPAPKIGFIDDDGSLTGGGVPGQMGSVDSDLPSGKYACLSTILVSGAQGCLALLQRVE